MKSDKKQSIEIGRTNKQFSHLNFSKFLYNMTFYIFLKLAYVNSFALIQFLFFPIT